MSKSFLNCRRISFFNSKSFSSCSFMSFNSNRVIASLKSGRSNFHITFSDNKGLIQAHVYFRRQNVFTSMEIPDGSLAWALQKIQHKARLRLDILVFLKWAITVSLICTSNLLPCAIFPSKCRYASSSINSCVAMFSWERPYKASKAIFNDCFRKRPKLNLWFSLQGTCEIMHEKIQCIQSMYYRLSLVSFPLPSKFLRALCCL